MVARVWSLMSLSVKVASSRPALHVVKRVLYIIEVWVDGATGSTVLHYRVSPCGRFLIKGSVAGGAVYLVYDQELLGPSDKSQAALQKAGEVVPPAMYQFSQYVCQQTGLQIPQLPAPPKIYFPIRDSWNAGIMTVMSALSVAPSKAREYSKEGWEYVKARTK
ncbi:MICOS complex subunit MIC13 isoform X1 [Pongo abelii]|nr:MICOS complex subunit MIC13 isoform X1 [Pongo abelii]